MGYTWLSHPSLYWTVGHVCHLQFLSQWYCLVVTYPDSAAVPQRLEVTRLMYTFCSYLHASYMLNSYTWHTVLSDVWTQPNRSWVCLGVTLYGGILGCCCKCCEEKIYCIYFRYCILYILCMYMAKRNSPLDHIVHIAPLVNK